MESKSALVLILNQKPDKDNELTCEFLRETVIVRRIISQILDELGNSPLPRLIILPEEIKNDPIVQKITTIALKVHISIEFRTGLAS